MEIKSIILICFSLNDYDDIDINSSFFVDMISIANAFINVYVVNKLLNSTTEK